MLLMRRNTRNVSIVSALFVSLWSAEEYAIVIGFAVYTPPDAADEAHEKRFNRELDYPFFMRLEYM